jgi:hypothetical protein
MRFIMDKETSLAIPIIMDFHTPFAFPIDPFYYTHNNGLGHSGHVHKTGYKGPSGKAHGITK